MIHSSTFNYLKPTEDQLEIMDDARKAASLYANWININVPEGPDKTFILRSLRTVAMWVNVAVTRDANGGPLE